MKFNRKERREHREGMPRSNRAKRMECGSLLPLSVGSVSPRIKPFGGFAQRGRALAKPDQLTKTIAERRLQSAATSHNQERQSPWDALPIEIGVPFSAKALAPLQQASMEFSEPTEKRRRFPLPSFPSFASVRNSSPARSPFSQLSPVHIPILLCVLCGCHKFPFFAFVSIPLDVPFPLTPALSPRERESRRPPPNSHTSPITVCCRTFPLSPRERAGVRGNETSETQPTPAPASRTHLRIPKVFCPT